MNETVIGIIGGMGPEATAKFFMQIIKATGASTDQQHYRVVIDSNAKIPDRTKAILGIGESPVPEIIKTGKNLETIGAQVLCIPCITSHYFYDQISNGLNVKLINFIEELGQYIKESFPHINKIGVLATTGTVSSKLFDKYMPEFDIIYPEKDSQDNQVMEAIYGKEGIKAGITIGYPIELIDKAGRQLTEKGAQVLIAGCTEIGLVKDQINSSVPVLDPMTVVAQMLVKRYE